MMVEVMIDRDVVARKSSLFVVFVGAIFVLPSIRGYSMFSYRVLWGKAKTLFYGEQESCFGARSMSLGRVLRAMHALLHAHADQQDIHRIRGEQPD